jgi:hypothetical protein
MKRLVFDPDGAVPHDDASLGNAERRLSHAEIRALLAKEG